MRLLLDTQAFIWFINGDSRLSANAKQLIEDMANSRLLSTASLWEIAIKMSIGKMSIVLPYSVIFPQQMDVNLID